MINKSAHDAKEHRTLGGEACQSKLLQLRSGLEGGALKASCACSRPQVALKHRPSASKKFLLAPLCRYVFPRI